MRSLLKLSAVVAALLVMASTASAQFSTPVRDVENPIRSPWRVNTLVYANPNEPYTKTFDIYDAPTPKVFVIEFVSLYCEANSADSIYNVGFAVTTKTDSHYFHVPISKQGTTHWNDTSWSAAQTVRVYFQTSQVGNYPEIKLTIQHLTQNSFSCFVSLSGQVLNEM
jgi:hypothetical protein